MTTLTTKQLIDILFQKPERITAGILEERSIWEKTRDHIFAYNRHKMVTYTGGLLADIRKLKRQVCLEFNEAAKVEEEHPRSLRRAMLELKAIGFSNEQVNAIRDEVYQFTLAYIDSDMGLKEKIKEKMPMFSTTWNDRCFLGAAVFDLSHLGKISGYFTLEDFDDAPIYNSAFPEDLMDEAYDGFKDMMEIRFDIKSELLKPASVTKRAVSRLSF